MKKWHLWLAASIGLVVIVGMMIREFDVEVLSRIDLSPRFFLGVVMGVLLFAVQNLMLTLRFRHLCQRKLSVAEAFRINVLCEFTSAVTPSAVGEVVWLLSISIAREFLWAEVSSPCLQPCWLMRLFLPSVACCSISVFHRISCSAWLMEWGFLRMLRTNGLRAECRLSSSSAPLSLLSGRPSSTSCCCIVLRFWAGY